jgi:dipeptidyl-peptidase III
LWAIFLAGEFLVKLQTIKATGDSAAGEALFDTYSRVDGAWARWRDIVMLHKQPRNIFVQPNTAHKGRPFCLNTISILH